MTDKPIAAHELRALWQRMPTTPVIISPAEMRARAQKFQAHIRRRNFIEYAAIAFVVAAFAWHGARTFAATSLWSAASVLIIAGALVCAFNLHRRARAVLALDAGSLAGLVDFHRAELTRQRNALLSMWRWYLLPLLPGLALFVAAAWIHSSTSPHPEVARAGVIFVILATVVVVMWATTLQLLGAARLQRMIEDLDRYRDS